MEEITDLEEPIETQVVRVKFLGWGSIYASLMLF